MKPVKSHHLLSSETGPAGQSPSRPERSSFRSEAEFQNIVKWQKEHLTSRLLSCSRSPRICTRDGKVGLSLGSPCQQASMMPYLPAESSTSHKEETTLKVTKSVVCNLSGINCVKRSLLLHFWGCRVWCSHPEAVSQPVAELFVDLHAWVRRRTWRCAKAAGT